MKKPTLTEQELDKSIIEIIGPLAIFNRWYAAYQNLQGKSDKLTFAKNLEIFFGITRKSYTGDATFLSREEAWDLWVKYISSKREAVKYLKAVDSVTPYS